MQTETMTLTEFLLERIAEDEARVDFDPDGEPWLLYRVGHSDRCDYHGDLRGYCTCDAVTRVLMECEAKRRIVAEHSSTTPVSEKYTWAAGMCSGCNLDGMGDWASRDEECPTLRALAAPYADHPDYRDEWKP